MLMESIGATHKSIVKPVVGLWLVVVMVVVVLCCRLDHPREAFVAAQPPLRFHVGFSISLVGTI